MPTSSRTRTAPVDAAGHVLRADAAASYLRMIAAGMPAGGVDVFTRTVAEQAALYVRYLAGKGPIAARPVATAPHIDGRAIDLHTTTAGKYDPSPAHLWLTAGGDGSSKPKAGEKLRAHTYGWRRTVPSERWHFEYDRAADTKRAADLAARLKALGYPSLKAFQSAHGLTPDGVDGPYTWAVLLGSPTPSTTTQEAQAVKFRCGSLNVQAKRWGGGGYAADAAFVKATLRPSVLFCQETDDDASAAIIAAGGFKTWGLNLLRVYWLPGKYDHGVRMALPFGTPYHGAVATVLTSLSNGQTFVACSVHVRPNDAFTSDAKAKIGKAADVATLIEWLRPYPRVAVGGDWSTEAARPLMEAAGYRLATPWEDSYDKAGVQRLDAIYVRGIDVRGASIHPTGASDHHGLLANLTIPASVPAT